MLKRSLIVVSALVAALVVAGATLPWWLGMVLRWQGGKNGLTFGEYQAVGYARWALADVRIDQPGWSMEVDRIEAAHPWWLWRAPAQTELQASGLTVELKSGAGTEATPAPVITPRAFYDLLGAVVKALPTTRLDDIAVNGLPGAPLTVQRVTWEGQRLSLDRVGYQRWDATLTAQRADDPREELQLTAEGSEADWKLSWRAPIDSLAAELAGHWRGQPIEGRMALGDTAWRPELVELSLPEWKLAAEEVGLSVGYAHLLGSTFTRWEQDGFTLATAWRGEPLPDSGYTPMEVRAEANGNESTTRIEALQVSIPGLALSLDQPLQIDHDAWQTETVSNFTIRSDLAALPWIEGSGEVSGLLKVRSAGFGWPEVEYDLSSQDLTWRELSGLSGRAAGMLAWPHWRVAEAEFADAEGNRINVAGEGKGSEELSFEWKATVQGTFLSRWLDDKVSLDRVAGEGSLNGAWPDLTHAGELQSDHIRVAGMKPFDLVGRWSGQGVQAGGSASLTTKGAEAQFDFDWRDQQATLQAKLSRDGGLIWAMPQPARIDLENDLQAREMWLKGPGIEIRGPEISVLAGKVEFSLVEPDWSWLADWWENPPAIPLIRSADGELAWGDDRVVGRVNFDGDVPVGEHQSFGVVVAAESTGDRLQVVSSEVSWQGAPFARLQGRVPISLRTRSPYWEIDDKGEIDASLKLEENLAVWQALNEHTRIDVQNPRLEVDLAGTWRKPRGEGYLGIERITFAPGEEEASPWPVVSEVTAKLVDDGTGVVVDPLTAKIDGQVITFTGEVPFTPTEWSRLSADPLAFFRDEGRGRLSIPRAELSAFAKFLPAYLVPTGELEVELNYAPDSGTDGRIQLQHAVSKPLGPLGVLQDINADLRFENRSMSIEKVSALMGGQPLQISGSAGWPQGKSVELALALQGSNLPIVRKTGVLLRSDLDLRIDSDASGAGKVSGEARLRDGLVLVDVRSLVPRGGGGAVAVPARRPPYFSITVPPLNLWELEVRLRGEDFLRLRTPVITGVGSLLARLEGTLESPLLLGEMELREADLRLPFARLEVDEALVRLTEADPYDPQIWLEATGQRLGYDLRLELEGKASEPQLTLQSSPSLTAEQVLMLVMAGVTPTDETDLVNTDRAMRLGMYFGQGLLGDLFGTDERERLSVSTGEKLSRLGKETYEFEYEIADRWAVVGEYDEFDYYNAALKWRVRPGKPKPPAPPPDAEPETEEDEDE